MRFLHFGKSGYADGAIVYGTRPKKVKAESRANGGKTPAPDKTLSPKRHIRRRLRPRSLSRRKLRPYRVHISRGFRRESDRVQQEIEWNSCLHW